MAPEEMTPPPEGDGPTRPRRDRTAWYIVGALTLLWIGYLAFFGPGGGADGLSPPPLRDPLLGRADDSWTLERLDGAPASLAEFRGRPIFLNIWATWCGPCLSEMPAIDRLVRNPRLGRVAFLGVSNEDADTLRRFVSQQAPAMTILRGAGPTPDVFFTQGIPATFIIAPDGRIVASHVGAARWDDPSVVALLEKLSADPGGAEAPEVAVAP